jgi:hypothetical protein
MHNMRRRQFVGTAAVTFSGTPARLGSGSGPGNVDKGNHQNSGSSSNQDGGGGESGTEVGDGPLFNMRPKRPDDLAIGEDYRVEITVENEGSAEGLFSTGVSRRKLDDDTWQDVGSTESTIPAGETVTWTSKTITYQHGPGYEYKLLSGAVLWTPTRGI